MLINGKAIAQSIQQKLQKEIETFHPRKPCLAVILVGEHPPSQMYVKRKMEACAAIGILSLRRHFPVDLPEKELIKVIEELNNNPTIDGILIQLPLPSHINTFSVISHIAPNKDVDGLHPLNVGKLLVGDLTGFVPCTPLGIKSLLQHSEINITGKQVLIIGRSNLVGKPTAALLMQNAQGANATVTIAHQYTRNLKKLCLQADVLIVAIGKPKFITAEMVHEGSVIVDVGINKVDKEELNESQIVGDVDFEGVRTKCAAITPVPGGVGPMTIAMLLSNTVRSYRQRTHPH